MVHRVNASLVNAATSSTRAVFRSFGAGLRPSVLVALLGAPGLLTMTACSTPGGDAKPQKTEAKSADAKKADAKKADASATKIDAKKADGKTATLDPKRIELAKDPELEAQRVDGGAAPDQADPSAKKYRRGMTPPPGMSPEELEKFATDVGDPTGGRFTLAQAFEGDPTLADPANGKLVATFDTSMGSFECELFEDQTPLTVANFVGLARGTRPTYDKKEDAWVTKKYYDGVIFHRVIKNFMVQTGDATNTGRGNPGYVLVDEFVKGLGHDSAGVLSMANRSEPNTGNTQFFITVRPTKHLDGKHAVFGKCADAKVPVAMSQVKVDHRAGDRPYEQIKINTVTISRRSKTKK